MKYRFDNAEERASGGLGAKEKQLKSQLKMNVFISLAPFPTKYTRVKCVAYARARAMREMREKRRGKG